MSNPRLLLALLALVVLPALGLGALGAQAAEDIVIGDFEGADYGTWKAEGKAFGQAPSQGTMPQFNQMPVSGFLGHGLVNSFLGGDDSEGTLESPDFTITRPYLDFLLGGGRRPGEAYLALVVDGAVVRAATGTDSEALVWANWDVGDLHGKTARIRIVDHASGGWGHIDADQIVQADERRGTTLTELKAGQEWPVSTTELYNETFRPQFHFTAKSNWLNDPNGLVFYHGEYHLFFQHNPAGINWGNMTWGHAVSTDLMHWQQLPNAIEPDALGTIFSGSAAVDWDNTAGFQKGGEKTLVAMYTAAGNTSDASKGQPFTQCLAYSNDRGRTWTKFAGNPVVKHLAGENRDPKIVWHAPSKRWILALYLEGATYGLFSSPDLKQWTKLQSFDVPGAGECPDFFPMSVDGGTKWVLTPANGTYLIGDFDGTTFKPAGEARKVDFGADFYAVQSYSDIPASDGRRIQIGWMVWVGNVGMARPGALAHMPFNQQMSIPCELSLHRVEDGLRMFRYPVREVELLRAQHQQWKDQALAAGGANPLAALKGDLWDIDGEFIPGDAKEISFTLRGQSVRYRVAEHRLEVLGNSADLALVDGRLKLRILVDRTSLEVFGNDGRVSFTSCFVADPRIDDLALAAQGGTARIVHLEVHALRSAWRH